MAKSRSLANHDESLDGKREPAIATQSTVNFQSAEEGLRGGHSANLSAVNLRYEGELPMTKERVGRRRPTTAPRSRAQNARNTAVNSSNPSFAVNRHRDVSMYLSSDCKVKSYINKELTRNKFISSNDYKIMTRRAQELHKIEATYLGECLSKPAPKRVTPKFSSTQQAQHQQSKKKLLDIKE